MSTNSVRKDNEVQTFGKNFCTVAETNKTDLGLTDQDVTQLADLLTEYNSAVELANKLKIEAAAATKAKDEAKQKFLDKTKKSRNKVNGTDGVPDALKAKLGITIPNSSRNALLPSIPADIVANLKTDGSVEIYWLRNGNTPATQYILEMLPDQSTTWTVVDVISRTSFLHKEPPPVAEIKYRVSARRRQDVSPPSNMATVILRKSIPS